MRLIKRLTGSGARRELSGKELIMRDVLSAAAGLYLIFAVLFYPEPILHRAISFSLFFIVIFISFTTPGSDTVKRVPFYDWVLSALSAGVGIYMGLNFNRIIHRMVFADPILFADIIFGAVTIILLFEGTRRVIGPWLPGIGLIALVYMFFGHLLPGRFTHLKYSIEYITDGLVMWDFGIWGSTMGIATGKIMVFLFFGTLFAVSGAGDFLFEFVSKIAGRRKGGVAKVAILSSAMFGMISGSPLTNATTTGAMTIPAMKKSGFSSEYASSIESCASVGGIYMPPIMGNVAFVMSDVVGIPYFEIVKRAILPAIVYFSALFFSVDFRARKKNIDGSAESIKTKFIALILKGYNFFIPIIYLVVRLMSGRSAAKAGLETIAVMIVIGVLNKKNRMTPKVIFNALKTAVNRGVMIVSTMALCGILVGVINLTGMTAKLSSFFSYVSDISLPVTLIAIMLFTLFLGLAMNISASYLIAAVLGAPILISLGFEPLGVHMFILFFAAMATITPPVAITSFAAATIGGASPMKVGFMSMKVGIVAYILPFVFIFKPEILMYGTFPETLMAFAAAFIGTAILAMGIEGWMFGLMVNTVIRVLLAVAGIAIVVGNWYFMTGAIITVLAIIAISVVNKYIKKKNMEDRDEKS